jgi:putative transposase
VRGRSRGVMLSFVYWSLRRLLELMVLRRRPERETEIEILVLRHQLRVLERQVARPAPTPADRALLAPFSRVLPRQSWTSSSFVTRPRSCVGTANWSRAAGRIHLAGPAVRRRRRRCAALSWAWHARTRAGGTGGSRAKWTASGSAGGEHGLDDPHGGGIEPAPRRLEQRWAVFLRQQAASILECDFLTVDTLF